MAGRRAPALRGRQGVGEVTAPRRNGKAAEPKRPSSRAEAIAALRAAGVSADVAELYADAWVEWREAVDNLSLIHISHPTRPY